MIESIHVIEGFQYGAYAFFVGASFVAISEPGEIFGFFRKLFPKWHWLQKLLSCSKCISFWCSFILSVAAGLSFPVAILSGAVAIIFGSLYDKFR